MEELLLLFGLIAAGALVIRRTIKNSDGRTSRPFPFFGD